MLYFKPKKTHAGIKFTLQFNTDSASIQTTDKDGKQLQFNNNPYSLYNYEMVNVGEQINTDPGTQYNHTIDRGVTFILSASNALNNKMSGIAQTNATVSIELVQGDGKSYWVVEQLQSKEEPTSIQEAPEKGVDWDKIAEGKVRHGFALEAFKLGLELTQETKNTIQEWVQYVMTGDTYQEDDDSLDLPF